MTQEGPGAGFFPTWYGIAIVLFSAFLVFSNLKVKAKPEHLRNPILVWLALAACVAFFKVLGFVISFGLFTFFVVAVTYRRPARVAAVTAAGIALGFYCVFKLALGLELPAGPLGF